MPVATNTSNPKKRTAYHYAALYCVWSPLLLLVTGGFFDVAEAFHYPSATTTMLLQVTLPLGLLLSGILCGFIALLGIPVHGRAGLLGKGLWGLFLHALIILVVLIRG